MFIILKGETNPRLWIEWHSCLQPWHRQFLLGDVSISRTPQQTGSQLQQKACHTTPIATKTTTTNVITYMYILKSQSQHNHNQEKERLCCSLLTLLRQLVGNLCPTGNGMTMSIIVKAHTRAICHMFYTSMTPKKIENYLLWKTIENREQRTHVYWTNRQFFCKSITNLSQLFR